MIRVLAVDDSAVMRQALRLVLGAERDFEVKTAPDVPVARSQLARARPDVLVLDLVLPGVEGEVLLAEVMASPAPVPVVVCSGVASRGTERALAALRAGAVAVVNKPVVLGEHCRGAEELVEAVRGAAGARIGAPARPAAPPQPLLPGPRRRVVAVGASTGGTEALRVLLPALPPGGPPLLIVQHIPEPFASAFTRSLQAGAAMEVRQARHGELVVPGLVLVAPGDRHLRLVRRGAQLRAELDDGPPISRHRPSVDALLHSVAGAVGGEAVGVLLTGMGEDGAAGLSSLRKAGAWTIAQSEESCVVYGMPREAARRGGVCESLPLEAIAARLLERATRP